jgi:hypothetical protein
MPEEFDARAAFASVTDALDAQTGYLRALDAKQDAQGEMLTAAVAQLREVNANLVRGFPEWTAWVDTVTKRLDELTDRLHALETRDGRG